MEIEILRAVYKTAGFKVLSVVVDEAYADEPDSYKTGLINAVRRAAVEDMPVPDATEVPPEFDEWAQETDQRDLEAEEAAQPGYPSDWPGEDLGYRSPAQALNWPPIQTVEADTPDRVYDELIGTLARSQQALERLRRLIERQAQR